eukprot:TRINITY_DN14756_c0_g1_i2.p1 TRINITY_DN14756_c0_g1~~TRINITY_DN14756_c0_g1_i2.p1  ORF type:complete len:421 (-),score=56.89 TRINITY_DN14756_c0_g1_i2:104-1366(-)
MTRISLLVTISILLLSLLSSLTSCAVITSSSPPAAELMYEWSSLVFDWSNIPQSVYDTWISLNGSEHCMLAGIKISHTGDVYVSVPRWTPPGTVPSTLNKIVPNPQVDGGYMLQPYPSYDMNKEGDPNALQSVLGYEIDSSDRLWILDQGKVNSQPAIPGAIKLIIWDITTNTLVKKYVFSEQEAGASTSFLNDIVINTHVPGGSLFAYITDSGLGLKPSDPVHGALIVYDYGTNTVRRILDSVESTQPDESLWITINGDKVLADAPMRTGADGLALNDDGSVVFWCPLTSTIIYALPTSILHYSNTTDEQIEQDVIRVYDKGCASDGLAYANNGVLYITSISNSSIIAIDLSNGNSSVVVHDSALMVWPDTIGFDHKGSIMFVSNQLYKFVEGVLDFSQTNFRIWKVWIGANSYLDDDN